jgi:septal ring factor EnvC (AmiA/AmiB activator)
LNKTDRSLKQTKKRLNELVKEKSHIIREKQQQETVLAKQLRTAYSTGHHDYLKLILNQQDAGSIQRTVTYYQYLNKARIKEIEQYKETIAQLVEITSEQKQQAEQLQTLEREQIQQKTSLESNKEQRQTTVAQLNKQLLNSKQRLVKLEEEEADLVAALARIAQLSKQEVDLTGLSKLKRKLSWPVKGKINRSFGSRKQDYLKWKGVLMAAPLGRQVKTIHNGTVLFSDWLKGYGLVTVIDHGEGYMSLYGHNQTLLKSVGERVETGEPIALVGQSGGQSQSALYFEIRYNGQAVNPKLWCR